MRGVVKWIISVALGGLVGYIGAGFFLRSIALSDVPRVGDTIAMGIFIAILATLIARLFLR